MLLPLEEADPLQVLPPLAPELPRSPPEYRGAGGGTLARADGDEVALRAAGGATAVRGGVTAVGFDAAAAVRPFSRSLLFAEEEAAEEFAFTKRCSPGS